MNGMPIVPVAAPPAAAAIAFVILSLVFPFKGEKLGRSLGFKDRPHPGNGGDIKLTGLRHASRPFGYRGHRTTPSVVRLGMRQHRTLQTLLVLIDS